MKIGLVDVDRRSVRGKRMGKTLDFPNLALMKISAWHKARGDEVEWHFGLTHYDRVYMSKVFTFSPDYPIWPDADEVIQGGTGYGKYEDLPQEIDDMYPDYSIYPDFPSAVGFLTRGCIRNCPWCVVPRKEGRIRPYRTWQEVARPDSNEIIFLDNNILASEYGLDQVRQLSETRYKIDFNQGLDARLITPEVAQILARVHWLRFLHTACDTSEMIPVLERAVGYLRDAGLKPYKILCYNLVRDVDEGYDRVMKMRALGINPYVQPYRDFETNSPPTQQQKDLARWVNNKFVFKSCTWEEYQKDRARRREKAQNRKSRR